MSQANLAILWEKLGLGAARPAKRIAKGKTSWGTETEQLENRALLSAASRKLDDVVAVEAAIAKEQKATPNYPEVAGTWDVEASGGILGTTSGTAIITKPADNQVSAVITLGEFPSFTATGKFTKKNDHLIKVAKATISIPGAPSKLKISIQFGSGENPTTFTGVAKAGKTVVANISGEIQV